MLKPTYIQLNVIDSHIQIIIYYILLIILTLLIYVCILQYIHINPCKQQSTTIM